MSKRNVAYVKPEEPAFLKRIKQEIGYKETEDHLDMKVNNLSWSEYKFICLPIRQYDNREGQSKM